MIITVALLSLAACSDDGGTWTEENGRTTLSTGGLQQREDYVEQQCGQSSMVGVSETFEATMNLRREELRSLEGTLSTTRRTTLSQALEGYSVRWQFAQNDRDTSCRAYAACRFINNEHAHSCRLQREDFNTSRNSMNELLAELSRIDISSGE